MLLDLLGCTLVWTTEVECWYFVVVEWGEGCVALGVSFPFS